MFNGLIKAIFVSKKTSHCVVCGERFPIQTGHFNTSGLCVCRFCIDKIDSCTSPMLFEGTRNLKFLMAAYPYTGVLRGSFLKYKFHGQREYGRVFSEMMIERILPLIGNNDFDLVIPVPLSAERMTERGYNQTAVIAKGLADAVGISYSENALFRTRNTVPQSMTSYSNRITNVKDAFLADKTRVGGKKILLTDDIYTVGATMDECAKELLNKGAKLVAGAVFFKTFKAEEKRKRYVFEQERHE